MERTLCFFRGASPLLPEKYVRRDYFVSAVGELCRALPGGDGAMVLSGKITPELAASVVSECRRRSFGAVILAARPSHSARALSAALCREIKVYAAKGCFSPGCTMLVAPVWGESLKDALCRAITEHGGAALYHRSGAERFTLPVTVQRGEALSPRELRDAAKRALRRSFSPELCRKYIITENSLILYDDGESLAAKAKEVLNAGAELIYEDSPTQNFT